MSPKALRSPGSLAALVVAVSLGELAIVALVAGPAPSRADAESLKRKVTSITDFSARPTAEPHRTTVTEDEVNAFLALDAGDQLPAGVVEPAVTIIGTGRVSCRAKVDLDAVRKQKPRGLLDPLSYATGRVQLTATGVLTTSNGVGMVDLQSATLGPLPIPKVILQEIVSFYSRTPDHPSGIDLDAPFALPARIREIQVQVGRAVVVQ
jgi:hypothetical protein